MKHQFYVLEFQHRNNHKVTKMTRTPIHFNFLPQADAVSHLLSVCQHIADIMPTQEPEHEQLIQAMRTFEGVSTNTKSELITESTVNETDAFCNVTLEKVLFNIIRSKALEPESA